MRRGVTLPVSLLLLLGLGGNVSTAAAEDLPPSLTSCTDLMSVGSSGDCVRSLQQSLVAVGLTPFKQDGLFGARTRLAVFYFQGWANLSQDGIAGPDTIGALDRAANSPPAEKPGMPAMPEEAAEFADDGSGTQVCKVGSCHTYMGRGETQRVNDAMNDPTKQLASGAGAFAVCKAVSKSKIPRAGTYCDLIALAVAYDVQSTLQNAVNQKACFELTLLQVSPTSQAPILETNNGRNCVP